MNISNDKNDNKEQILLQVFKNKLLLKYILSKIRFISLRCIWSQSLPNRSQSNRPMALRPLKYESMVDAHMLLEMGYTTVLIDKMKLIYIDKNHKYRLVWTTKAYQLVSQLYKDESTLSFYVDSLKDKQMQLLDAATTTNNLTLFKMIDLKVTDRLISTNRVKHVFELAIRSGSADIVEYIMSKYAPDLKADSLSTAVNSSDPKTISLVINSLQWHRAPSGKLLIDILLIGSVDVLRDLFNKSDSPSPFDTVNTALNIYTQMHHKDFTWNHLDSLVYLMIQADIQVDHKIVNKSNNPYNLDQQTEQPYYLMFKLMQSTEKECYTPRIYQNLLFFNNIPMIDYMLNSTDCNFPPNYHTVLFNNLVHYGTIETVMKYASYQQPHTALTIVPAHDSLAILMFLQDQKEKYNKTVEYSYNFLLNAHHKSHVETVLYIYSSNILEFDHTHYFMWDINVDLRIALAERYGVGILHWVNVTEMATMFKTFYEKFGANFIIEFLTESRKVELVNKLVRNRLKEEFEIASRILSIKLDPILFLETGDIDWLKSVIASGLCLAKTTADDNYLNSLGYFNIKNSDSTLILDNII